MANWDVVSRSNYFKVKDAEGFKAWAAARELEVFDGNGKQVGLFAITPEGGHWPISCYKEETDEYFDVDLVDELAAMLDGDQIVIFMSSGAEKVCYVTGTAMAFNAKGEMINIDLNDIYKLAAEKFNVEEGSITACEY